MQKLLTLVLMSVLSFGVLADDWKKLGELVFLFRASRMSFM